jgi:hypothetical protein
MLKSRVLGTEEAAARTVRGTGALRRGFAKDSKGSERRTHRHLLLIEIKRVKGSSDLV